MEGRIWVLDIQMLTARTGEGTARKLVLSTIAELYRDTYLPHLKDTRRNMESDLSFWKVHLLPRWADKHLR